MKLLSILHLLLFVSLAGFSQSPIKISGKVIDSLYQKPVGYASITVTDKKTEKAIGGSISDNKGAFTVVGIRPGVYRITVEFVGYRPYRIDSFVVTDKQSSSVGTIILSSSAQTLQGVTVVGKTPIVENKIDKIVYNAANDITSQGGAAIDVLRKVPQVTVDIDGNVELQGNNNIRFLINGKPSSMFGASLADALASIPASQIKSIEAITSPGAKYDAQGTGGIINIILKESKIRGINGSINLSAGSRLENGSVSLNFRQNKLGINAFFSGNGQLKSQTPSSQIRTSADTSAKTLTRLVQDSRTEFVRNGYQSGIGFDYTISKQDGLTGNFSYNHFSNRNEGITDQQELVTDLSSSPIAENNTTRQSFSRFHTNSYDWSLDYKHKFKTDGQELEISYNASAGKPFSNYTQTQNYKGNTTPFAGRASNNPGTDKETEIAIDYTHPVSDNFLIETGLKTVLLDIKSISNVQLYDPSSASFKSDPAQSYQLGYSMKIYAGYLSTTFSAFNWLNIKAGARYEYTDASIDFPNTTIPSYGTFVPSLILSHDLTKEQTIKVAYSHRIERPEYRELNPFLNISDPYNISTGNPLLRPEIGDNFELAYNRSFPGGGSIYFSLIERINSHDIKNITTFYPSYSIGDSIYNNVSLSNIQNIGTEYNSGISLSGSLPIKEKFTLRSNLQASQRNIVSPVKTGGSNMGVRVRFNINASCQLPANLVVETFANYNSASRSIQGKVPQSITYTFGARKQFWNKKASVGLTATNPFNKYIKQETTIETANYVSTAIRRVPFRSFGISFNYKFGKLEFRKKEEQNNNDSNTMPTLNN
jgi:outer membrane receptor protein involved in Fe transport